MRTWLTDPAFLGRVNTEIPWVGVAGNIQFFIDSVLRTTASDPPIYAGMTVKSEANLGVLLPGRFPAFSDTVILPSNYTVDDDEVSSAEIFVAYFPLGSETVSLTNDVASESATFTLT